MIDAIPDYTELPLGRFLDMVASREPAPGGNDSRPRDEDRTQTGTVGRRVGPGFHPMTAVRVLSGALEDGQRRESIYDGDLLVFKKALKEHERKLEPRGDPLWQVECSTGA
jgi:hypothetical protein